MKPATCSFLNSWFSNTSVGVAEVGAGGHVGYHRTAKLGQFCLRGELFHHCDRLTPREAVKGEVSSVGWGFALRRMVADEFAKENG